MEVQEVQTLEKAINVLADSIVDLTQQKIELEARINELEHTKASLVTLLPHDKRIDQLFK